MGQIDVLILEYTHFDQKFMFDTPGIPNFGLVSKEITFNSNYW